jgi:hypothetical protein
MGEIKRMCNLERFSYYCELLARPKKFDSGNSISNGTSRGKLNSLPCKPHFFNNLNLRGFTKWVK